ncbi:GroES family chaperonin [Candidatus Similichlamydia epinepheli]|uniref:GroES family chaperonin n=1 Tax=Candidatus Similichlamydia epinepheli TaxID=1903953 RepID=UPI000D36DBD4|nr:co-chaperone GroES [Candidatus Similichlamydia epinepheli]
MKGLSLFRSELCLEGGEFMAKLRPLGSRVLLKRASENKPIGGIVIPNSEKEKPSELVVVCCAEGCDSFGDDFAPLCELMKEGARVLISPYSGVDVRFEGDDFVVVSSKDILGVLPS